MIFKEIFVDEVFGGVGGAKEIPFFVSLKTVFGLMNSRTYLNINDKVQHEQDLQITCNIYLS